jgi:putative DNA primase/helicase
VARVHYLEAVRVTLSDGAVAEKGFSLETDVDVLEDSLRRNPHIRLIVIDPISAYLGGTESNTNSEVRGLLSPLAALAGKHSVAIVAITHLRKSSGAVVHRSIGSIAFAAAARAVWAVAPDPSDPSRYLFLPVKQNLAANVGGLAYRVEAPNGTPKLAWQPGSISVDPNEVLSSVEDRESSSDLREAKEWLRDQLAQGPVSVKDIQAQAKAGGHSWITVRRAKKSLSVVAEKSSYRAGWQWRLEDAHVEGAHPGLSPLSAFEQATENKEIKASPDIEDAHPENMSTFNAEDDGEVSSRQATRPGSHCNETGKCHCPLCRRQGHCSVCDGIGRLGFKCSENPVSVGSANE